jgi:Mrp family chromosome partitioning ATPase
MPPDANVTKHRERALKDPPKSQWRFANTLCVRAESHRSAGESLTVLVTSSANGAGSTTIAAAVARRFAAAGLDVLLIDADPNMPELSYVYAVNDSEQGSLASLATTPLGGSDPDGSRDARTPTRSRVSGLSVVGIGSADDITLLRRLDPRDLLSRAGRLADVVVVDGGSLLESGSTVQLMQVVDAVILAVPLRWQDAKELTTLSLQLRSRSDGILTVLSPVSRSAARRSRARGLRYRPAELRTNEPVGSGAGFPTPDATHPILHSSGRAAGPVPPKQDESRPSRLGSRRRRGASQKQISESAPTTTNGVPMTPGNDLAYAPLAREAAASPEPTPPDPVSPR